tara:strand:- start:2 stop:2020 length:2019 start_codon:yes stop_codon:yes gene_type:complete
MKTTHYRLCTLTQLTTQAILTTMKTTTILTLMLYLLISTVYAQCPSPVEGIEPLTEVSKCISSQATSSSISYGNSNFPHTWLQRIQNYNNQVIVGAKQRFRSVMVNTSVNKVGGVGVPATSGSTFYFNPNAVGSTIGVDEDGNGVYERENDLLQQIVDNDFDEIAMYSISQILQYGDEIASSYTPQVIGPLSPHENIMQDQQRMDWHIARFVYKAKTTYNLDVLAIVTHDNPVAYDNGKYTTRFYNYFDTYARSDEPILYDTQMVTEFANYFILKYQQEWEDNPSNVKYLRYGEDTLLLPKDEQGRISTIDKMITDVVNLNLFEYRVKSGFIEDVTEDALAKIGTGENRCDNGFDGHLFEWEWWNHPNNQDVSLGFLLDLIQFSKSLQQATDVCYPAHYVCQDEFDGTTNWTSSRTEQQRVNLVDQAADRIYLYTYNKNPCDCYWGRGNNTSLDKNDFKYRVELLKNNSYGANNSTGETFILPVFNPKYKCTDLINSTVIPEVYGDNQKGCNNPNIGCDFDAKYSGTALDDLDNEPGYLPQLGYVENIFQEQYDFDFYNTSTSYSSNHIYGYCWFKVRLLTDNGYISSTDEILTSKESKCKVYPNPSSETFHLESNELNIERIQVFTISGELYLSRRVNNSITEINIEQSGTYFLRIEFVDGNTETQKLLKW